MELDRLSALRPRNVWDLLDDAFDLYRERFTLLAGIAALPFVPGYLLSILLTTFSFRRIQESVNESASTNSFIPVLIFLGALAIGLPILAIARSIQYAVTAVVLDDRFSGKQPSARLAWKRALPRIFPILVGILGLFLLMVLVFVCSAGMLVFLGMPFIALIPICMALEKRPIVDGFQRNWRLTATDFGRALGLNQLIILLEFSLFGGLFILLLVIMSLIPGQDTSPGGMHSFVTMQAALGIAALFAAPLGAVATTLFYFDCRVRREGLDLMALAHETDIALAEAPQR